MSEAGPTVASYLSARSHGSGCRNGGKRVHRFGSRQGFSASRPSSRGLIPVPCLSLPVACSDDRHIDLEHGKTQTLPGTAVRSKITSSRCLIFPASHRSLPFTVREKTGSKVYNAPFCQLRPHRTRLPRRNVGWKSVEIIPALIAFRRLLLAYFAHRWSSQTWTRFISRVRS